MKFGAPYYFGLLWLVPVVAVFFFWAFRRKAALIERFVSADLKDRLLKGFSPGRQKIKAALIVLAVFLLIFSLTRPKWGFHWEEVHRRGVDILVALDVSQSMMAEDVEPNRLERAKREILDLLHMTTGDRIGLIAFAGTSFLQCPLTLDHGAVQIFLDSIAPDLIPVPGTAISEAITRATEAFGQSAKRSRALILITDGEDHEGKPIEAAKAAAAQGIRIYTVGIGKEGGAPIPNPDGSGFKKNSRGEMILTKLDEETLQKVALETGGSYVRSVSGDLDLESIYHSIQSELEAQDLKSGRRKRFEERFQWPLLFAILLLVLEALMGDRVAQHSGFRFPRRTATALFLFFSVASLASPGEGVRLYEKEQYQKSLEKFIDAQVSDPNNPKLKFNLASNYYKLGQYPEAEKLFQSLALSEQGELQEKAFYNLGNTAFREGKLQESIAFYEKALALDPKDEDARHNLEFARKELKRRMEESKNTQQRQQQHQQQKQEQEKQQASQQKQDSQDSQKPNSPTEQQKPEQAKQDSKKEQEKAQGQGQGEEKKPESMQQAQGGGKKGEEKPMSEEEANRWLSKVKEGQRKNTRSEGGARYRVEKDW